MRNVWVPNWLFWLLSFRSGHFEERYWLKNLKASLVHITGYHWLIFSYLLSMGVLVRLVKRCKPRFRTALRSWMPRRGATTMDWLPAKPCDVAWCCSFLATARFLEICGASAWQIGSKKLQWLPWHTSSQPRILGVVSETSSNIPHQRFRSTGATGAAGSFYEIGCKWPLGTLNDSLSHNALTKCYILSVLLAKPHPFRFQALFARNVIMMLSIRAGTGRLAREICQVYVNDQSRWAPVTDTNRRFDLNILKLFQTQLQEQRIKTRVT